MTETGMIVVSLAGLLAGGLACIGVALRREWRTGVQSKSMRSPAPYTVGQALRVSYEADDPKGADIVDRSIVLWLAAIGLLLTLIATILLTDVLKHGLPAH